MSSHKVPLTFTFRRDGVRPPLYVVGSFSTPPWEPEEMDASADEQGEFTFTKNIMVDEDSVVQYKFRHVADDWWSLDPNAGTITDDYGNTNSVLRPQIPLDPQEATPVPQINITESQEPADVPSDVPADDPADDPVSSTPSHTETSTTGAESPDQDTDTADSGSSGVVAEKDDLRRQSLTPIEEVAGTAAEVADSAAKLDDIELELGESNTDVDGGNNVLMLSHERFDSPSDSTVPDQQESEEEPNHADKSSETDDHLDVNYDDPQLEQFPHDRGSIIATMRHLSTTVEPDSTMVNTPPLSPVTKAQSPIARGSSPTQHHLSADDTIDAQDQLGDTSWQLAGSKGSSNSLQSITEEEIPSSGFDNPAQYVGPVEPRIHSSASDSNEDEGISMGDSPRKRVGGRTGDKIVDDETNPTSTTVLDEATTDNASPVEEATGAVLMSPKANEPNGQSGLQKSVHGERPDYHHSIYATQDKTQDKWLHTFLRTIFVDWIGGVVGWLCGRERNEVRLALGFTRIGAVVVLGASISLWALQDRLPPSSLSTPLGSEHMP